MNYSGRDIIIGAFLLALSVVLPMVFHAVGLGSAFLPMFYPIIMAGFLIELPVAAAVGLLAPLTSALLTGMPPFFPPIAFIMMVEGLVLASVPGILHRKLRLNIFLTLSIALLLERGILLVAVLVVARWLSLPEGVLGAASLIRGLPGIIFILILIPPLVRRIQEKIQLQPSME